MERVDDSVAHHCGGNQASGHVVTWPIRHAVFDALRIGGQHHDHDLVYPSLHPHRGAHALRSVPHHAVRLLRPSGTETER
jgi:hypothetical protein